MNDAKGNEGRALLPESESTGGRRQGQGSANLPSVNGSIAGDRTKTEVKKEIRRQKDLMNQTQKALGFGQMRRALQQSGGNMVLAAHKLCVTVSELDAALRMSNPGVMGVILKLVKSETLPEYIGVSLKDVQADIERRRILYKSEALDAIYELAKMPINPDNAFNNQIKLLAASRLYQETGEASLGSEIDQTLRSLNDAYQKTAPKLKVVRETIREIQFEEERPAIEGKSTVTDD